MELIKTIHSNRSHHHEEFRVFYSYISLNDPPIYRSFKEDCLQTFLQLYNGHKFWGEDPRPFFYKGRHYVLSQRFLDSFHNMENYIVDVFTGESELYKVDEPNFFHGKNWTPFVYNDELYIIHCFSPFRILKNGKIFLEFETNLPIDYENRFTQYRGGTNGIQLDNNRVFGVGHRSIYCPKHVPFIWVLDFKNKTFDIMETGYFNNRCILNDPTSLWKENDKFYVSIFEAFNCWFQVPIQAESNIYHIDINACLSGPKTDTYHFSFKKEIYHFITFADESCKSFAENIKVTADSIGGFDTSKIYTPDDLSIDFKIKNENILKHQKGFGYYVWKPYVVLKHLHTINDNDILCYCDSKYLFTNNIRNISFDEIFLTHNKPNEGTYYEKQFTKGAIFDFTDSYDLKDTLQVWAGFILIKKTKNTIDFISKWLELSENENLITDSQSFNLPEFIENRWDQSLLSILAKKQGIKFVDFPDLLYNIRVPQSL